MSDVGEQDIEPLEPDSDYDGAWKEALRRIFPRMALRLAPS